MRGIMVLFWKQMHLQYDVGCFTAEVGVVRRRKKTVRTLVTVARTHRRMI